MRPHFCDDLAGLAGHWVKIYIVGYPAMPAKQEQKLLLYTFLWNPAAGWIRQFHLGLFQAVVIVGISPQLQMWVLIIQEFFNFEGTDT